MADTIIASALDRRDVLLQTQQELYVTAISNINMRCRDLLTNDFGTTLARNCVGDLAGEIVRRYFDTADYYVTADQMARRILSFSYDSDFNPLSDSESARKAAYNMADSPFFSSFLQQLEAQNHDAQKKLFEKERVVSKNRKESSQYKDQKLMNAGKAAYRADREKETHGNNTDELTGVGEEAKLEVDHVQAAATVMYNSRYLRDETVVQELKKFYNSSVNFQMLAKRANESKGDVRVFSDGKRTYSSTEIVAIKKQLTDKQRSVYQSAGKSQKEALALAREDAQKEIDRIYTDITYKASASQVTKAVCDRWENAKPDTREALKKSGHLDADGKVPATVKRQLEADLRHSMNEESKRILKGLSYATVAKDASSETVHTFSKIVIGQVVYYILPPTLFETQQIIRKKNMTVDKFLKEIKHAGGRIIRYAKSKLGEMLKNIAFNSIHKFLKVFFDIIISTIKETVKRLVKLAKSLVLSLVQSIKILTDKKASPAEKADAITKIFAAAVTNVVLEVLFETIEDALGLNDYITEPLQMIISIIVTNLVMLILQKADLFDVQYGILVANMDQIFLEERRNYLDASDRIFEEARSQMTFYMDELKNQITHIEASINILNLHTDDVLPGLEEINTMFTIGIDFQVEWEEFCRCV